MSVDFNALEAEMRRDNLAHSARTERSILLWGISGTLELIASGPIIADTIISPNVIEGVAGAALAIAGLYSARKADKAMREYDELPTI